jgi:hypothetical protein
MEEISREDFEKAMEIAPKRIKTEEEEITEEKFQEMLKDMQNPVNSQKEIAVKIKIFLDKRIKDEMDKNGVLGDNTRRWIETYTTLLEKLQRAIHGDKSLNLHVHKITHGEIAAKIREYTIVGEKKKKKQEEE